MLCDNQDRPSGWFWRWQERGLFAPMMLDLARLHRRAVKRKSDLRVAIIDTQTVKRRAVRAPRGFDAAKRTLGRKRVALVDATGTRVAIAVAHASVQERVVRAALQIQPGA